MSSGTPRPRPAEDVPAESAKRACDQCRLRKVKCDKGSPCGNCTISSRQCSTAASSRRQHEEKKTRVLISSQYERKIDMIESRLSRIEDVLQTICSRLDTSSTPGTLLTAEEGSEADSTFEARSSLAAQTVFASEFLESAVAKTSLQERAPDMQAAMQSLKHLVKMHNNRSPVTELSFRSKQAIPPGGLCKLPMPPLPVVLELFRTLESSPPTMLRLSCSATTGQDFEGMCRRVYSGDETSPATFTIVNAALYYLFQERAYLTSEPVALKTLQEHISQCAANIETALSSMPLLLPGDFKAAQALAMGALYAVDACKPSVAWHLNSNAAQICQSLGIHRSTCLKPEETMLFFHIYLLDRCLTLRMGRAAILQDWDLTPPEVPGPPWVSEPMSCILKIWMRCCRLQSRAYEGIYSPAALECSRDEIERRARGLARETEDTIAEYRQLVESIKTAYPKLEMSALEKQIQGEETGLYAVATLIYRAIPPLEGSPTSFIPECVDAARIAMQTFQVSMEALACGEQVMTIYIHWSIFLTPFAPYFVLICHAIETSSTADLEILKSFLASLEPACESSETVAKLHKIGKAFYNAALVYVESRRPVPQQCQEAQPRGEFDMYLSQLGFMPGEDLSYGGLDETGLDPGQRLDQATRLGDWFSVNRNIMGLLEEDLSTFEPMNWM